ncbi:MAG: hypothetical protein A2Y25_04300 [Candidatus Melainabacteria bacterium GWF2_37_15]|nr:MAG: hypothetical protein A2Y25_04300 [Candidatus Melainabacteria bacterium GWF2_37_15]
MALAKNLVDLRDKVLKNFMGPNPFVPQILIGLGSISFMPWIIATNKKEEPGKRIYAATRTLVQEGIALPIALGTAALCGALGSKLATNSTNKLGIIGLSTTVGFALANLVIPPLTTTVINKLPIKEKVHAMAMKKQQGKLDITSYTYKTPMAELRV